MYRKAVTYAERRLGVTLDAGDFAIVYFDTSKEDWLTPIVADGRRAVRDSVADEAVTAARRGASTIGL